MGVYATLTGTRQGQKRYPDQRRIPVPFFARVDPPGLKLPSKHLMVETSSFEILAGILQGDTFALFLLILVVGYTMRVSVDKMNSNRFLSSVGEAREVLQFFLLTQILPMILVLSALV